jgi:hypothetical protein
MRRLLILAAVLFASLGVAWAQLPWQPGVGTPVSGGGTPFTTNCSESNTFLNTRVGGQGGAMSTTIAAFYDTMICGMVTDGNWATLDALYILAAPTTAIAEMNLISTSFTLTPHTGTFTANSDWQGNGSSDYLDTGFTPSTAGGQYTASSGGGGTYIINNVGAALAISLGAAGTGNHLIQLLPYFGGTALIFVNDVTNSVAVGNPPTDSSGCLAGINLSGFVTVYSISSGGTDTGNQATSSPALPDQSVYLGARNNAGTADTFSTYKLSAAWLGGAINGSQVCARINTFMTSQGVNAY